MKQRGVRLTKEWSMSDSLQDMMLEIRRHSMAEEERKNVAMMKDGLKLIISGVELVNNRLGLLDLDGWSSEVTKDLGKHDVNLARIYRKYWKRGASRNPESEIVIAICSSMGLHHMKRVMAKQFMTNMGKRKKPTQQIDDVSSDEDVPDVP